ncbi:MAG: transcriptional regulator [Verrucomicrobia bacterium]|nr:MAG: transcriptional regulator [Verrucomicrobiota bacterium]
MCVHRIFISSVQKEFAAERRALKDYIEGDPLLRRFFEVFLFEDLPASDRRADDVYLAEVDRSAIYLGLFGREYGVEDSSGVSPTEREFIHATERAKERLVFIVGADDSNRHPKMQNLIRMADTQVIRRRVTTTPELTTAVYASLVEYLERHGELRTLPFDASACRNATLDDIDEKHVRWFLAQARQRQYSLAENTPTTDVLSHLNLLEQGQPTNAAILLFGKQPQRFLLSSEVKCMHFHGAEIRKPIPSYQVYKGTSFELVDQAVDFVLSKIARMVGTRAKGAQAPVEYELPREAVTEAVVNAPERLTRPHASIPRNPLLAEPLFLARYIERAGTGTLDMIARCREAGLKQPEFRQDGSQFVQTLWRWGLTLEVIPEVTREVTPEVTPEVARLLPLAVRPASRQELQRALSLRDDEHFRIAYLLPAIAAGYLEMTIPEKPTSRLQKYRLTEKGRAWLTARKKEEKK